MKKFKKKQLKKMNENEEKITSLKHDILSKQRLQTIMSHNEQLVEENDFSKIILSD